jgi:hypothetical protein
VDELDRVSSVMMCFLCVALTRSIMAASVVDLPEPVGPVTRTRPFSPERQRLHDLGKAELLERPDLRGNDPENGAFAVPLVEHIHAEPRMLSDLDGEVQVPLLLEQPPLSSLRIS